jgi:hypothetical protein
MSYDPKTKVIALVDNAAEYFSNEQVFTMPILLPPYAALEQENIGNINGFWELYYKHLASPDADSCLALICTAMYSGFNILLYVSPDEECLTFTSALLKYMQDNYGLTIANKEHASGFDMAYEDLVRIRMYKYGYIPPMDVIMNVKNKITDPMICDTLIHDLKLPETDNPVSLIDNFIRIQRNREPNKLLRPVENQAPVDVPWKVVIK